MRDEVLIDMFEQLMNAIEKLTEEMKQARGIDQLSVDKQLEIKTIAREFGRGNKKPLQIHNGRKI